MMRYCTNLEFEVKLKDPNLYYHKEFNLGRDEHGTCTLMEANRHMFKTEHYFHEYYPPSIHLIGDALVRYIELEGRRIEDYWNKKYYE